MSDNPPKWMPPEPQPKTDKYILKRRKTIPVYDLLEWADWYEKASKRHMARKVRRSYIGRYHVSTVFLGLDHGWGNELLLFETMIFDITKEKMHEIYTDRCTTWRQALAMHRKAKKIAKTGEF